LGHDKGQRAARHYGYIRQDGSWKIDFFHSQRAAVQ
jgi:hypothetical protein